MPVTKIGFVYFMYLEAKMLEFVPADFPKKFEKLDIVLMQSIVCRIIALASIPI